jgi:hypothetical protein
MKSVVLERGGEIYLGKKKNQKGIWILFWGAFER